MKQIEILREINDIIDELHGMEDLDLRRSGLNMEELLNPSMKTLIILKKYRDKIINERVTKESIGKSLWTEKMGLNVKI